MNHVFGILKHSSKSQVPCLWFRLPCTLSPLFSRFFSHLIWSGLTWRFAWSDFLLPGVSPATRIYGSSLSIPISSLFKQSVSEHRSPKFAVKLRTTAIRGPHSAATNFGLIRALFMGDGIWSATLRFPWNPFPVTPNHCLLKVCSYFKARLTYPPANTFDSQNGGNWPKSDDNTLWREKEVSQQTIFPYRFLNNCFIEFSVDP